MKIEELMLLTEMTAEKFITDYVTHMYMPVINKHDVAESIAKICTEEDEETGLMVENILFSKVVPLYALMKAYTNIDIGDFDNIFEFYDLIMENENTPFGKIVSNFYSIVPDTQEVLDITDLLIERRISVSNSISAVVSKIAKNFASQLPTEEGMKDLISQTKQTFDGMNANKLKSLANIAKVLSPKIPDKKE
jgi:hypothetical protein